VCATFDSTHPSNWNAETGAEPTPLAANHLAQCPPPTIAPPRIAINEIYYHPLSDKDAKEEYVELRNNTSGQVNLKSYAFVAGIDFTFAEDTIVEPGGFVVVCRDVENLRAVYGLTHAVGNFMDQLSNDGERLTLVDPSGALVDSVRYEDNGDWPVPCDGLGYSLERIHATGPSDDPANWREAGAGNLNVWKHVELTGVATSSRVLMYIYDGPGEFLLDNLKLYDPANPAVNLFTNGTFETGLEPWIAKGNHADTSWDSAGGVDGTGAMHIIADGRGSGATNGISLDLVPELIRNAMYKLSFDYKYVTGGQGLILKLSGAIASRGIYFQLGAGAILSPGAENNGASDHVPPFAGSLGRFPREPGSTDAVWLTARARAEAGLASVKLRYLINNTGDPTVVDMLDDGKHGDGAAGDGVFGAQVPAQPHNTIVTYTLELTDTKGAIFATPRPKDPSLAHGFYVNDLKAETNLPNYTLLLTHTVATPPRTLLAQLNCSAYRIGDFAYRGDLWHGVGIRQRGQSVCGSTKPFLKVRFVRGREFPLPTDGSGVHKLNLQSLWTDKSLVRENNSWEAFEEVGMPACAEEYIRLHCNGKYYGLYAALEHPDARFLRRNRLNAEGNLYKATASTEEATGTYEKKTNESVTDMSDLRTFLSSMHATPRAQLKDFFAQNVDADRVIDYQLAQTLTNNSDYPHKNHYLYHDTESNRWMPLTWDMDLTFGKLWDGTYGGVLHDKMHTPGNNPWYTTSVDGGLGNHLLDKFFSQGGDFYRRAYVVRLFDALQEKYTEAFYTEKLAFEKDFLFDEQAEDIAAWGRSAATADDRTAPKEFLPNLERVMAHIRARRSYLLNYLKTRTKFDGHDRLKITEVMYNPGGSGEDLEFLELWNPDEREIDVSGWSIEGFGFDFPAGTKVGPLEVFVVAKDPAVFAAQYGASIRALGPCTGSLDNDGEILRLKDAGPGYPATVDFLRYGSEHPWPRDADGLGYTIELTRVAGDRDNDLGVYWRRSLKTGGSPGFVEGVSPGSSIFRRGDVNSDGATNVTDAIGILRYLFQGAGEPPCLASADVDANGLVKAEDALLLLQYLFQAAASIPSPGPGECAPAPDVSLCKQSNCSY